MTDTQRNKRPARRPDCVTETRIGNTILVVSGFFKEEIGRASCRERV